MTTWAFILVYFLGIVVGVLASLLLNVQLRRPGLEKRMDQLSELRAGIEASGARAAEVLASLEEADLDCPANPEWTVRDLLIHLATSERGVQGVIEGFLRGESIVPEDFDLDRWNQSQVARLRGLSLAKL